MAIARMKKLLLAGHRSIQEELLEELHWSGMVQMASLVERMPDGAAPPGSNEPSFERAEEDASRVRFCLNFIESHGNRAHKGLSAFLNPKKVLRREELKRTYEELPLDTIYSELKETSDALQRITEEEEGLGEAMGRLEPWSLLSASLDEFKSLKYIELQLCRGVDEAFSSLAQALEERGLLFHLEVLSPSEEGGELVSLLLFLNQDGEALREELAKVKGLNLLPPPPERPEWGSLSPSQALEAIARRREELEQERTGVLDRAKAFQEIKAELAAASDYLNILRERREARRNLAASREAFLLEGWMRAQDVPRLESRLNGKFKTLEMCVETPVDGEEVPVSIVNPPQLRPFATITQLYGLPRPEELDPTPFLAPFYFLFFGFCLSDVGYGLAQAAICLWMLRRMRPGPGASQFFRLLILGGLSSAGFGLVFGSWFGNGVDLIPWGGGPLKALKDSVLLVNPVENPVPILLLALGLGVVQLLLGLALKLAVLYKNGERLEALLGPGVQLFLVISFLLLLLVKTGVLPESLSAASLYLAGGSALLTVISKSRDYRNPFMKVGGGLLSLYGLVGYLGDVLSYSRLFALGLATGVIAVVVNVFVQLVGGTPYVGVLLGFAIFMIGHVFNLLIGALGAFIHSARLQYVEFFTKFYVGGGSPFAPFRVKTQWVEVVE